MAGETRILAVDDSSISQRILKEALVTAGYEHIDFASSGSEALACLGVEGGAAPSIPEPSAILLDIVMPGIDGIETAARIRSDSRYQYTPILMVTSEDNMDTLAQAYMAGANDYVRKPFDAIELMARLRNVLCLKGEIDRRCERERELAEALREVRGTPSAGVSFDAEVMLPGRAMVDTYLAARPRIAADGLGVLAMQIDGDVALQAEFVGHTLLSRVASCLASLPSRLGDILAHYEGGTFIALLSGASAEEVSLRAEAARQAVQHLHKQKLIARSITLSIGAVHASAAQDCDPRRLLTSAVAAMEHAAYEGGNRIVFTPAAGVA